jgi:hypothetical protein
MDTTELAEEFIAMCFGRSGDDMTGADPREVSTEMEDGRLMMIAANPRIGTATIAMELNLDGIVRPADGELDWVLLQSTWDDRLGNGFVAAREQDGKDMIALTTHRSTASVPGLTAAFTALSRIAEKPGAASPTEVVPEEAEMTWLRA